MGGARRGCGARGRGRSIEGPRHGRVDLDRASVRRDGWTDPDDARERARSPRRAVRLDDGLRRGRHGPRDGDRAMSAETLGPRPTLSMELDDDVLVVTVDRPGE